MAFIGDYVLHLARDRNAAGQHLSRESAIQAMTEFGLNESQQNVLLSGSADEISRAIQSEFDPHPAEESRSAVNIGFCILTPPPS
jgi:hypothetical protein